MSSGKETPVVSSFVRPAVSDEIVPWQAPTVASATTAQVLHTADQLEKIQEEAREEARTEGHASGYKEGYAAGLMDVRREADRLQEIIELLQAPLQEMDVEVVEQLAHLAATIARQLLRRELQTRPEQIVEVVRESVGLLPAGAREIIVRLHPEDGAVVREHLGEELSWKLIDDPALKRGGCAVEAEHSRVNASVERRLEEIMNALLGEKWREMAE